MNIEILILISSETQADYKEYTNYTIKLLNKIDEGSSGKIYLMKHGGIMKLYKNSIAGFTNFQESDNLIPENNENREIPIFLKIIQSNGKKYTDIIAPYALGLIKKEFIIDNEIIRKNTYFSMMPHYELIKKHNLHNYSILDLLYKITKAEYLLEKYFNIIHCDINLRNIVVEKENDNFMLIDYGVIKTKKKQLLNIKEKTKIWPKGSTCLDKLPIYSICILIINLLIGPEVYSYNNNEIMDKLRKKLDNKEYDILYNCLYLKYNSIQLLNKLLSI